MHFRDWIWLETPPRDRMKTCLSRQVLVWVVSSLTSEMANEVGISSTLLTTNRLLSVLLAFYRAIYIENPMHMTFNYGTLCYI